MMDIVERLKQEFSGNALKDIADQTRAYVKERHEAADEIERLRQQNAELVEALRKYADEEYNGYNANGGHARAAIAKATGGE